MVAIGAVLLGKEWVFIRILSLQGQDGPTFTLSTQDWH